MRILFLFCFLFTLSAAQAQKKNKPQSPSPVAAAEAPGDWKPTKGDTRNPFDTVKTKATASKQTARKSKQKGDAWINRDSLKVKKAPNPQVNKPRPVIDGDDPFGKSNKLGGEDDPFGKTARKAKTPMPVKKKYANQEVSYARPVEDSIKRVKANGAAPGNNLIDGDDPFEKTNKLSDGDDPFGRTNQQKTQQQPDSLQRKKPEPVKFKKQVKKS